MSNTPDTKLPKLEKIHKQIKICDDFYIGALKVLNETYLPKWTAETDAGYKERMAQTPFSNMFAPVVDGLVGLMTKKQPETIGFDNIDIDNIDLQNNNLQNYIKSIAKNSIANSLCFVAVETNKELNRSYLKTYDYDNLYSYYIEDKVLKQIVLKETIEVKDGDFGLEIQERFIVFKIGGGEVWYSGDDGLISKKDEWSNSMGEIPVYPIITGKEITDFEVVPKLYDIALLNRVHLNLESNLANVLGIIGCPTIMFFGAIDEDEKDENGNVSITIGTKDALLFTDKQKEGADYLEASGAGVQFLENKIKNIEAQIDKLTYKILLSDDSNTKIDAQSNKAKNASFLSDVAGEIENKIEKALKAMIELDNKTIPADASLSMPKDFDVSLINIDIAFKTLQAGDMSRETFYTVLATGQLPKDFNPKDETSRIDSEGI